MLLERGRLEKLWKFSLYDSKNIRFRCYIIATWYDRNSWSHGCRYSLRDNQSHPTQKSVSKSELILTRYMISSGGEENGVPCHRGWSWNNIEGFQNILRASPANLIKQILSRYIFNLPKLLRLCVPFFAGVMGRPPFACIIRQAHTHYCPVIVPTTCHQY